MKYLLIPKIMSSGVIKATHTETENIFNAYL